MTMTLEQFRATGSDWANLAEPTTDAGLEGIAGRAYCGVLYIEHWVDDRSGNAPPDGKPTWMLTIYNEQYVGDLPDLEATLYEWACAEGYCDDVA